MKSNWVNKPLGELVALQRGHDLPSQDRIEGDVPIMGSSGLTGFHNKAKARGSGVVIGRSGNSMGEVTYCPVDFWPLNTCLYVTDFKNNDKKYIYYLLKILNFDQFNSGSAQKSLNRNAVYPFEVRVTESREEQIKIGQILSNLENKIEINNQINQTLESIAQAIFKSWFIDFEPVKAKIAAKLEGQDPEIAAMCAISGKSEAELKQMSADDFAELKVMEALFPDELVESELGEVPKGWEVYSLSDLSNIISKGTTPRKQSLEKAQSQLKVPFIKVKDLDELGNILINNMEYIPNDISQNELKRSILECGDILFSIAGTIGRVAIISEDFNEGNVNQALAFIRLKNKEIINLITLYLKDNKIQKEVNSKVVQGVQANASLTTLRDLKIKLPNDFYILSKLCVIINILYEKKKLINQESQTLKDIRDILLPKLLSGEVDVSELQIEDAVA